MNRRRFVAGAAATANGRFGRAVKALIPLAGGGAVAAPTRFASFALTNTAAAAQPPGFISPMFGHPFRKGDVPAASFPEFRTANGAVCPYTMINPAFWGDGSLRFAGFLLRSPVAVPAMGSLTVNVFNGRAGPGTSARSLADFAAGGTDLVCEIDGQSNLDGTWISSLNQGIADNDDVIIYGDGGAGKVWRVRQQFMQSGQNHGQLECYWYIAALQNANGGLYGLRVLGRMTQPWYDINSPSKKWRGLGGWRLKNGSTLLRDLCAELPNKVKIERVSGVNRYDGCTMLESSKPHGLTSGLMVRFSGPNLPSPLTENTNYWIRTGPYSSPGYSATTFSVFSTEVGSNGGSDKVSPSGSIGSDASLTAYPYLPQFCSLWTCGERATWDFLKGAGSAATDAAVRVQIDRGYWKSTGLIFPYDLSVKPTPVSLSYSPMTVGQATVFSDTTGEGDALGPLPKWCVDSFLTQSAGAELNCRIMGLVNGNFACCFRDSRTKTIPVINNRTYSGMPAPNHDMRWYGAYSYTAGFTPPPLDGVSMIGFTNLDHAHGTSFAYYPYLLTGEPQYLDLVIEMAMSGIMQRFPGVIPATVTAIGSNRNNSIGGVQRYAVGIGDPQGREDAWTMRDLVFAVAVTPDGFGECGSYKQYFSDCMNDSYETPLAYYSFLGSTYFSNNGIGYWNNASPIANHMQLWQACYSYYAAAFAAKACENENARTYLNRCMTWTGHLYDVVQAWGMPSYQVNFRSGSDANAPYIRDDALLVVDGAGTLSLVSGSPSIQWASANNSFVPAIGDVFMFPDKGMYPAKGGLPAFTPLFVTSVSGSGVTRTIMLSLTANGPSIVATATESGHAMVQPKHPVPLTGAAAGYTPNLLASHRYAKAIGAKVRQAVIDDLSMIVSNQKFNYNINPIYAMVDRLS